MARGNALQIVPTTPITKALVAPPKVLRELVEKIAAADERSILALCRTYANHLKEAQDVAERLACEIERRLRVVEGASKDVANATGNVLKLSTTTPLPVSAVSALGVENAAAHGDHTHEGLHSLAGFVGDVTVSGNVVPAGNNLFFPVGAASSSRFYFEVPAGVIDGFNDAFTLSEFLTIFMLVQDGVIMEADGNDYTLSPPTITYIVGGKVPAVGSRHWAYVAPISGYHWATLDGNIDGSTSRYELEGMAEVVLLQDNVTMEGGSLGGPLAFEDFRLLPAAIDYVAGKIPQAASGSMPATRHWAFWTTDVRAHTETPAGAIDGVNDTFTLSGPPGVLLLVQDGAQLEGGGVDYTLTGDTIVYVPGKIPAATSRHWAYWVEA